MRTFYFFIILSYLIGCTSDKENSEINNSENSLEFKNKDVIDVYKRSGFEIIGRIINETHELNQSFLFNGLQLNYNTDTCKILHYLGTKNTYLWNDFITISSLYKNNNLIYWEKLNCSFPIIPKNPYDLRYLSSLEIDNNLAQGRIGTSTYPSSFTAIKIFSNNNYIRNFNLTHNVGDFSANDIGLTYNPILKKIIVTTLNQNYEQKEINYISNTIKSVYNFDHEKGKNDHVLISGINSFDSTFYLLLARLDLNNLTTLTVLDSISIKSFCTNCKPIRLENFEKISDDWYVFESKQGNKQENIIIKVENEKLKVINTSIDCSGIEYKDYGQIALHKNNIYAIRTLNIKKVLMFFENGSWNTVPTPNFNDFVVPIDLQVQFIKSTPKGLVVIYNGESTTNSGKPHGILDIILIPI